MPAFLPRHPRTRAGVLWALFVLTVCALVAMVVATLVQQLDPASQGERGTAVITRCWGQGTNQQCFGSFGSDDGAVHLTGTRIWGEDFAHLGERFTAYYDAGTNSVDTVVSGEDLTFNLVVIGWLLALGFVQFWFRIMVPRQRRRYERLHNMMVDLQRRHPD